MTPNSGSWLKRLRIGSGLSMAATLAALKPPGSPSGGGCTGGMDGNALIDTGAILALLDRRDRWHQVCVDAFRQLRLPLLTSEAVLTELFHLVGDSRVEMEAAWKLVRSGALALSTVEDAELPHLHQLMPRYPDGPVDFAAGTHVYPAKRESQPTRLVFDPADFATHG